MARRLTNNESLDTYREELSRRKSNAKAFFLDFLETLDNYYPYDFDYNLNRKKNPLCETKPHFEFICKKMDSKILKNEKIKEILFIMLEEKFYKVEHDSYNSTIKYISNLFNNNINKSDNQTFIVNTIINSF